MVKYGGKTQLGLFEECMQLNGVYKYEITEKQRKQIEKVGKNENLKSLMCHTK